MSVAARLRARLRQAVRHDLRWAAALAMMTLTASMTGMLADAAAQVRPQGVALARKVATVILGSPFPEPQPVMLRWVGKDVDGDGAGDFFNPTGRQPRTEDAYGFGRFGASRDGGVRHHEGVDFRSQAGQPVMAPISGYVTKIGFAYAGDTELKFVEITNPALRYAARVFYVDPAVEVGQSVRLGQPVGTAHTLQAKYPGGMTDHVHLELTAPDGEKFDATSVLTAHVEVAGR